MIRNGEKIDSAIKIEGFTKHYSDFDLGPINLEVPAGFVTAIIGENGAGKTTLLDAVGGIKSSDNKITWLEKYSNLNDGNAKNEIGWFSNNYFPEEWTLETLENVLSLAFDSFDIEKFEDICIQFRIFESIRRSKNKKIMSLSEGNKSRLAIASLLARKTNLLVLDEPDATLDPVMREKLNSKFREYLAMGEGKSSIVFSTHNVADMEKIVDYAVFLCDGKIINEGFVEDLKEKYRFVHGSKKITEKMINKAECLSFGESEFEALVLAEKCSEFDEDLVVEVPNLHQLSLLILKGGEE